MATVNDTVTDHPDPGESVITRLIRQKVQMQFDARTPVIKARVHLRRAAVLADTEATRDIYRDLLWAIAELDEADAALRGPERGERS